MSDTFLQQFWAPRNEQFRRAVTQPRIVRRAMQMLSLGEARARTCGSFAIGFEEAVLQAYLESLGNVFQCDQKRGSVSSARKAMRSTHPRKSTASAIRWKRVAENPTNSSAFLGSRSSAKFASMARRWPRHNGPMAPLDSS